MNKRVFIAIIVICFILVYLIIFKILSKQTEEHIDKSSEDLIDGETVSIETTRWREV